MHQGLLWKNWVNNYAFDTSAQIEFSKEQLCSWIWLFHTPGTGIAKVVRGMLFLAAWVPSLDQFLDPPDFFF